MDNKKYIATIVAHRKKSPFSSAVTHTFESVCGSWSKVLVRVKLEGQLPVCLLQIFITCVLRNTKDFIKVLAILYPAVTRHNGCQNRRCLDLF